MNPPLRLLMVRIPTMMPTCCCTHSAVAAMRSPPQWCETAAAMRAALIRQAWDVITSDDAMPSFSAQAALALAQEVCPDVPFIIVSGEICLDLAVSLMRGGAQDYIPKGELARLVPAIAREMRDAEVRRERQRAEHALRVSETRYRRLFEAARNGGS